jgi:hypothetical protein
MEFDPTTAKPDAAFDPSTAQPVDPHAEARQRGVKMGEDEGSFGAAVGQYAHQATFGLQPLADAAAQWARDRLTGKQNAPSFSEDLAEARGRSEGEIGAHPVAGTVGGVLGGLAGAKGLASAIRGTRFGNAIAAVPGQKVANVAKSAATNAAVGGGTALANGDNVPDAIRTASISAGLGPIVQKGAGFLLSKAQPVAQRAWQTLADTIGETPATLQSAYQTFQHLTGRIPSMAELVGLQSRGQLRDLAKANPRIAEAAMTAANMGGRPLHEQLTLRNAQNPTMPQTARGLTELRDREMDAAMNTPHPQSGLTLNDTPVNDRQRLLLDPRVDYALRPNDALNARLGNVTPAGLTGLQHRIETNTATIGDLEVVRKRLRDVQSQLMRPTAGSLHARDPDQAREFGNLAQQIEGLGASTDQDYAHALANYRAGSHYTDSFEHAMKGKAIDDVAADDGLLARALNSPAGQRGYQHGNALRTAQDALDAIAPGGVKTTDGGPNAGHVAQAAMAASSGGISSLYHAMKALPVVGDRVPERVQRIIADQLFNPATTQQGINNLRRAGVQARDMRALAAVVGGVAGQKIADYVSQEGQ